jgi:hypothetical protein
MTYYLETLMGKARRIAAERQIGMISAMCEARRQFPKLALLTDQELEAESEREPEQEDTSDAA